MVTALISSSIPTPAGAQEVEIPFMKYTLANGLTLIVHEDRKAPVVGVTIWYRVGSRNERPGRRGFAHLFEHLMYSGSENAPERFLALIDQVGATNRTGATGVDHTYYFETVPRNALDYALFLESDRMGHLLPAVDQAKLELQRGVVENEIREEEDGPLALAARLLREDMYPEGHPYRWVPVGDVHDLRAATLDEVRDWFRTYYGPNNAVLLISGAIDSTTARMKVERYFGSIPPVPSVLRPERWIPAPPLERRRVVEAAVASGRIDFVWHVPEWGSLDGDLLGMAAEMLDGTHQSYLASAFAANPRDVTRISASAGLNQLGGLFHLRATLGVDADAARAERALRSAVELFLRNGPTTDQLRILRARREAGFIRGAELVGSFGGKSDVLSQGEFYQGDPGFYLVQRARLAAATPDAIRDASRRWLSQSPYVMTIRPRPSFAVAKDTVDRSHVPDLGTPPVPAFPALQRAVLRDGTPVVLAQRKGIPLIEMRMVIPDAPLNASSYQMAVLGALLSHATAAFDDSLAILGADFHVSHATGGLVASLSALRPRLAPAVAFFADRVLRPIFDTATVQAAQHDVVAQTESVRRSPRDFGLSMLALSLLGPNHPLALAAVPGASAVPRASNAEGLHRVLVQPGRVTLIVAGDISLEELLPIANRAFVRWPASAAVVPSGADNSPQPITPRVYLIDQPGAQQTEILAGLVLPEQSAARNEAAVEVAHSVLGRTYSSRLNANLRETRHWTTRARTNLLTDPGPRLFYASAAVQADRTTEAMLEIRREFGEIGTTRPPTQSELRDAENGLTLSLPGRWESTEGIAGAVLEMVRLAMPDDTPLTYSARVRSVTSLAAADAARHLLDPANLVWVVVGDLSKIEAAVRALNLGTVHRAGSKDR